MTLPTLLLAEDIIKMLVGEDDIVKIAMIGGLVIAIIAILVSFIHRMYRERIRGQTQREIAAYVAEGSMTADEAERILSAGGEGQSKPCCGGADPAANAPRPGIRRSKQPLAEEAPT